MKTTIGQTYSLPTTTSMHTRSLDEIKEKERILSLLKTAFTTVTPWKKRFEEPDSEGWNECIAEIKKNRKKYLKFIESL